jgi:hypothetical protein
VVVTVPVDESEAGAEKVGVGSADRDTVGSADTLGVAYEEGDTVGGADSVGVESADADEVAANDTVAVAAAEGLTDSEACEEAVALPVPEVVGVMVRVRVEEPE